MDELSKIVRDSLEQLDDIGLSAVAEKISREVFETNGFMALEVSDKILECAIDTKDDTLAHLYIVTSQLFIKEYVRRHLTSHLILMSEQWANCSQDVIADFQFFKQPEFAGDVYQAAINSLRTWEERADENQVFFSKCVYALGAMSEREYTSNNCIDYLVKMSKVEPPIAAHWAKKKINLILKDKSPYIHEDLSEPPEIDYDWPYPDTSN